MKTAPLAALAAATLLIGCGESPDPWQAVASFATTAQPGVPVLLRTHGHFRPEAEGCAVEPAPAIEIVQDGSLGVLNVEFESEAIVLPDTPCDGQSLDVAAVYYEATPEATGIDTVVYRELRAGVGPDTTFTAQAQVR